MAGAIHFGSGAVSGLSAVSPEIDHGHAATGDGHAHGAVEDLRQLLGLGHQLDVVTAFLEQDFRVGGLEIVDADFAARDVRGDRQDRRAAAMAVEQAVDHVQVARPATAHADRQLAGQLGLGAGGRGASLFMAHAHLDCGRARAALPVKPFRESPTTP